jgi:large subunit ribosomal protein L18
MSDRNKNKRQNWLKKRSRVKHKLGVRGKYPRLVVYRSNIHIYAQLVDDNLGNVIASASSNDKDLTKVVSGVEGKINKSSEVGKAIGAKIKKQKIEKIVFDRNGYKYHGRVKALADAVRESGIQF